MWEVGTKVTTLRTFTQRVPAAMEIAAIGATRSPGAKPGPGIRLTAISTAVLLPRHTLAFAAL